MCDRAQQANPCAGARADQNTSKNHQMARRKQRKSTKAANLRQRVDHIANSMRQAKAGSPIFILNGNRLLRIDKKHPLYGYYMDALEHGECPEGLLWDNRDWSAMVPQHDLCANA
jgi:hypothetical protein